MMAIDLLVKSNEIETLRTKLVEFGMKYGFLHPNTIELSKELDQLIVHEIKTD